MLSVAVASRSFSKHRLLRDELSKRYQKVRFNDYGKTLQGDELIQFLHGHDMAILGLERIDAATLEQLPTLKVISRFGVGTDTLDLPAMKNRGVKLAVASGANKRSVSELVLAFAIMMLRQLPLANQELIQGVWQQRKGRQLTEKTVGIIGFGAVGKDLAALLKPFQCRVLVYDVVNHQAYCQQHNIVQIPLEHLLQEADIVSLHLPLNDATQHLLDKHRLAMMKPDAILINTARGGLVDELALLESLKQNKLAAAAFDVFITEPPTNQDLFRLANFFASPHIGGSTEEAIIAMGKAAISGLENASLL